MYHIQIRVNYCLQAAVDLEATSLWAYATSTRGMALKWCNRLVYVRLAYTFQIHDLYGLDCPYRFVGLKTYVLDCPRFRSSMAHLRRTNKDFRCVSDGLCTDSMLISTA